MKEFVSANERASSGKRARGFPGPERGRASAFRGIRGIRGIRGLYTKSVLVTPRNDYLNFLPKLTPEMLLAPRNDPTSDPQMTPKMPLTPRDYPQIVPNHDTKHTFQCFSPLEMTPKSDPEVTPQMLITPRMFPKVVEMVVVVEVAVVVVVVLVVGGPSSYGPKWLWVFVGGCVSG